MPPDHDVYFLSLLRKSLIAESGSARSVPP